MEQLFHDVLSSVLLDFTETIKTWTQTATSMTSTMRPRGWEDLATEGVGWKCFRIVLSDTLDKSSNNRLSKKLAVLRSVYCQYYSSFCEKSERQKIVHNSLCTAPLLDVLLSTDNQRLWINLPSLPSSLSKRLPKLLKRFWIRFLQDQLADVLKQRWTLWETSRSTTSWSSPIWGWLRTEVEEYLVSMAHQIVQQPKVSEIFNEMLSAESWFQR